jgi:menaquinone-9 beta-reductase
MPDAVIVGARAAGSAAAIALARAGRSVIALDRARFPSDTLSTHLLFPGGVAELQALGALDRVRELGAPPMPAALVGAAGMTATGAYTPIDGIAHALCVRRKGLDAALVATAREAGAEVREKVKVTDLVWDGDRVAGVVADGEELRAPLVVGADGRSSTVARLVGASEPYRRWDNERACAFAYWRDEREEWRGIAAQWREGPELGTAFPCDGGLVLVLLMPPVQRLPAFRADPEGEYLRTIEAMPPLRERLDRCALESKVRIGARLPSYFRRSAGPGWALPGDAGHFKDPVTAQGIRDALRFGRRLGECAAPVLDEPRVLDRALRAWEREREHACLETYQWTTLLGRAEALNPLEAELYRAISREPGLSGPMLDVFARSRRPFSVFTPRQGLALAAKAVARRRPRALRTAAREVRINLRFRAERAGVA